MNTKTSLTCALLLFFGLGYANNINVTNISLENLNTTDELVDIQFDLSWDNSWRISSGPANWDAAWVFVKFRTNSGIWQHATLNMASPGGGGATVQISPDEVGAMIYRSTDGVGNVSFNGIQLTWRYGQNGVSSVDVLDVQVFAIEMVYVPEAAFSLGDGDLGGQGAQDRFFEGGTGFRLPYLVDSEDPVTIRDFVGSLYYQNTSTFAGDQTGTLEASFPKGFSAFYCMKYEVTEGQWVGFFSTLTDQQKSDLDITGASGKNTDNTSFRNTISWANSAITTGAEDRPLGYASQRGMSAYLDWSGLRFMTELEYEKACRGPIAPSPNEKAWGNSGVNISEVSLINQDQESELIINLPQNIGNANAEFINGPSTPPEDRGPYRAGIFAASAINKTREETGGTYYGIMEMSGNLTERCITVGNARGRGYTGLHGDGNIQNFPALWPRDNGEGVGVRGGHFGSVVVFQLNVSRRTTSSLPTGAAEIGDSSAGFRGVRSAF